MNTDPPQNFRVFFVSGDDDTEQPESINQSCTLLAGLVMTLVYTHLLLRLLTSSLTENKRTLDWRFYGHLLQLMMALKADAWIGTRASNWWRWAPFVASPSSWSSMYLSVTRSLSSAASAFALTSAFLRCAIARNAPRP